ncbi:MAG TPA: cytochrome P460 family protein [Candidatus Methylomirabilis sp.]|nr:cytochrome P460 family protein [Candidatus Methylomirabilis sp.]
MTFPEGYKHMFTTCHTINFPATKPVRHYHANKAAAAKAGKPLPDSSVPFAEAYAAKLDADGKPVMGDDGFYVADKLLFYTEMASGAGWGKDILDMPRNGDWNYAVFTTGKQHKPRVSQAECFACHKPLDSMSDTFTLKQLAEATVSRK